MNIVNALTFLAFGGTLALANATPVPTPDPTAEAVPILQAKAADFPALHYQEGDHLTDLITRSNGRISLAAVTPRPPQPIQTDTLPNGILYWRVASFAPPAGQGLRDLVRQLQDARGKPRGLILDLRSTTTPDDYAGAEQLDELFQPLIVQSSATHPPSAGQDQVSPLFAPIVVLTNPETTGAAEALAGDLQTNGALVIGRPTAGRVAEFENLKLSTGQTLRFVIPPNGADDPLLFFQNRLPALTWNQPVMPDITLPVDDHAEKGALVLIRDNHLADVIQESDPRHRMNEAALVKGEDPEYDAYLASLESGDHLLLSLPPIHDAALTDAIDSLKAIGVAQAAAAMAPPPPGTLTIPVPSQ